MSQGVSNLHWEVVPFVFWDNSQKDTEQSASESAQRRAFSLGMIDPKEVERIENRMATKVWCSYDVPLQ